MTKELIILGAGGFAREVCDLAYYCFGKDPEFRVKGFLSDRPSNIAEYGYPEVLGTVDGYKIAENDIFAQGIGNVRDRKKVVEIIIKKGGKFLNLIHPTAVLSPTVKLGTGVAIKAFCVLASNVSIGDYTFLQSSSIFGHDVQIGNYCQINSFSFFAGCSRVSDLATVNAGVKVVQNVEISYGSTVGIGSVILGNVPPGKKVFGNPARIIDESSVNSPD